MPKFISIIFLAIPLLFFGQEKKIEINTGKPDPEQGPYNTYSFVNKEKDKVCLLYIGKNIIKGYILDKDYVLVKEFQIGKQPINQVLVGGFFSGEKVHFLLSRFEEEDEISHYIYDPATDRPAYFLVDLRLKRSIFLGVLSLGDQFLFVTAGKKEDKIKVFRFSEKESHEIIEFDYSVFKSRIAKSF